MRSYRTAKAFLPCLRVLGEDQHVAAAVAAEFQQLAAGFCFVLFFGPGTLLTLT
jgi:hypothetical protein